MTVEIICADALAALKDMPERSVHTCITSPPYWGLRDYGLEPVVWGPECEHEWADESYQRRSNDGGEAERKQETNVGAVGRDEPVHHAFCRRCPAWRGSLGLEPTPELYVEHIVQVMRQVRRVLRDDGTLWLNLGDSYAGSWGNYHPNSPPGKHGQRLKETARWNRRAYQSQEFLPPTASAPGLKPKDLVGVPWRVAFALQADGWWLRSDIVWSKPNPMPESVTDRPTRSHEYLFLLAKKARYYYDQDAIREPKALSSFARYESPRFGANNKGADRASQYAVSGGDFSEGEREATARNKRSVWEIATQPFSARALGGGSGGTKSPDCPVHGDSDLARQARRRALDDELQGHQVSDTAGNDGRRGEGPEPESDAMTSRRSGPGCSVSSESPHKLGSSRGSKTSERQPVAESNVPSETTSRTSRTLGQDGQRGRSSGFPPPDSSQTARPHSRRSHRTAPAPETSPPYTPSAQSDPSIADTPTLPGFDAPSLHMGESNSEGDRGADGPETVAAQTSGGRSRISCTCIIPDHFAVFPEKLVEPCILAGTSERGCCPECGAPWEREVERPGPTLAAAKGPKGQEYGTSDSPRRSSMHFAGWRKATPGISVTTGWRPTCGHDAEPAPCTVLDPFAGSGTVGLVAERLGRHSILIDASEEYCRMARERTAQMGLMV